MDYLNAFLCGGILCAIGQILIDKTQLTPARILTGYVVAGVILSALGVYQPIADWGGAGATVPLTGFGHALAKGVSKAVAEKGWQSPKRISGFTLSDLMPPSSSLSFLSFSAHSRLVLARTFFVLG